MADRLMALAVLAFGAWLLRSVAIAVRSLTKMPDRRVPAAALVHLRNGPLQGFLLHDLLAADGYPLSLFQFDRMMARLRDEGAVASRREDVVYRGFRFEVDWYWLQVGTS